MNGEYLILSLDRSTPGKPLTWWKPGGQGYTRYLDEAGRFTRAEVVVDHRTFKHHLTNAVPEIQAMARAEPAPAVYGTEEMRRPGAPIVTRRHLRYLKRDWL